MTIQKTCISDIRNSIKREAEYVDMLVRTFAYTTRINVLDEPVFYRIITWKKFTNYKCIMKRNS